MIQRFFLWLLLAIPLWAQNAPVAEMTIDKYQGAVIKAAAVGIKLWYGDGSVVRIAAADMRIAWLLAPADGVQVLKIYYDKTYPIWNAASNQFIQRRYADLLEGKDIYYWSPTKGFGNVNSALEVPEDAVTVKLGTMLPDGEFLRIYNKAHNDHDF